MRSWLLFSKPIVITGCNLSQGVIHNMHHRLNACFKEGNRVFKRSSYIISLYIAQQFEQKIDLVEYFELVNEIYIYWIFNVSCFYNLKNKQRRKHFMTFQYDIFVCYLLSATGHQP